MLPNNMHYLLYGLLVMHMFGTLWDGHLAELEGSTSSQPRRQTDTSNVCDNAWGWWTKKTEFKTTKANLPALDPPDDSKVIENEEEIFQFIRRMFCDYDTSRDEILTLPLSESNFVYQSTFKKCKNMSKILRQTFRIFRIKANNEKIATIHKKPSSVTSRFYQKVFKRK